MPSTADGVNGDVGGSPASSSSTEEGPEVATAAGICAADAMGTAPAASAANGDSKPHTNGGLVSPNGTHVLWDADTRWILMFDNLLREGTRSPTKRSCGCKGKPPPRCLPLPRSESRGLCSILFRENESHRDRIALFLRNTTYRELDRLPRILKCQRACNLTEAYREDGAV